MLLQNRTDLILGLTRKDIINKAIKRRKEILIFDDGLQDKEIDYDLKFVCFSSKEWIGNGRLIPSGPLREQLNSLTKYDAVFIKNNSKNFKNINQTIKDINPKIKVFNTEYVISYKKKINKKSNYLIFSGIGSPHDFKEILIKNKIKIVDEIIFPDHFEYKLEDIIKIKKRAKKLNAKIITTEKDFMKVKKFDKKNIDYLPVSLKIQNKDKLLNFIKLKLYE
jgi:tetraacyldisaccharide 4'-kinase